MSAIAFLAGMPSAWALAAEPPVADTMAQRMKACTVCHSAQERTSNEVFFPRIAGKPAGYLYKQLLNFREGRRSYPPMTRLIDPLSDAYLHEIAEHFASLDLPYPPPQPGQATPQELARGETLVKQGDKRLDLPACNDCHGQAMTGRLPAIPGLLGLPKDYLKKQLGSWRTHQRQAATPDCMAQVAKRLSLADVDAVANWLAAQPVPPHARAASPSSNPLPLECGAVAP